MIHLWNWSNPRCFGEFLLCSPPPRFDRRASPKCSSFRMLLRPLMSTARHVWLIQVSASSSSCFLIINSVPSWGHFTKAVNRRAVETAPPPMLVAWRKLVLPSWCPCVCFVNLIEIMKRPETDSVVSDKKWWAQDWEQTSCTQAGGCP